MIKQNVIEHMKTQEILQESSLINVIENEPGQIGRLAEALGVIRDDS